jgi:hypothetical protein
MDKPDYAGYMLINNYICKEFLTKIKGEIIGVKNKIESGS